MKPSVSIEKNLGEFSAAHQLPYHDSKCRNLHGHNYGLKIAVYGLIQATEPGVSDSGMVLDFGHVKTIYKDHIEPLLDHALILGTEPLPWYEAMLRDRANCLPVFELEKFVQDNSLSLFLYWDENNQRPVSGDLRTYVQGLVDKEIGKVTHLPIPVTTVEHLVVWIYEQFETHLFPFNGRVDWVQLQETENSGAHYFGASTMEEEDF